MLGLLFFAGAKRILGLSGAFLKFGLVSGFGWLIDVCFTMALVQLGLVPFWASFIGAGVAVTLVYVLSRLGIFATRELGGLGAYALYVCWQVTAIAAASALVAWLAPNLLGVVEMFRGAASAEAGGMTLATGLAKLGVTPLTLVANFLFMAWLTGHNRVSVEMRE